MGPDILLMFSGGLDSTGAFWKLLHNQKDKKILIHHMHLKNIERRALAEYKAVSSICSYMKNIGEFTYSESSHAYPCFNKSFIWDGDIASFIAGNICMSLPSIKYVALGRTASDVGQDMDNRIERAHRIFKSFGTNATKIYPVKDMAKQEIYDMLPEELRKMTWSCRTPIYENDIPKQCGKCITCKVFPLVKQE